MAVGRIRRAAAVVPKVAYSVKLRTGVAQAICLGKAASTPSWARPLPVARCPFLLRDARPPFRARGGVVSVLFRRAVGTLDSDAALSMFGPQS